VDALDVQTTHHAHPCVDGIVDRVETDVAVATKVFHFDDHQVMNMFQIIPDGCFGVSVVVLANDKITAGTSSHLASNMTREDELTIAPLDIDLFLSSARHVKGDTKPKLPSCS